MKGLKVKNKKRFCHDCCIACDFNPYSSWGSCFYCNKRDIRVSARVTGEKKALSAAEAGIHQVIQNFAVGGTASNVQVDPATDPDTRYSYAIGASSSGCTPPPAGFDIEKWSEDMYVANVTGTNTRYGSSVQIDVGIGLF
ncbi:hypothetical protein A45J_2670 [hot springs metagenome]|uniref:Uncharacterized protein n=1 Tax=hot springs metagenome TaxID=433727 RepID=A0A5J4L047_9ZZZZ